MVKYLKKSRIIELKNTRPYNLENPYSINLYFKKDDSSNIFVSFGISFKTTALPPIFAPSPINIGLRTFAPLPIVTLFSTVGCLLPLSFPVPLV